MDEDRVEPDDPLRAIVADDDPFARRSIREVLHRAGIVIVAEAHTGREAVELCRHYRPDVVLMDVMMPELDGIAATREIIKQMPQQSIVMLTSADEEELGMLALHAGAIGYLSKDLEIESLPQALLGARRGEAVISRRMGLRLVEHLRQSPGASGGMRPIKSPLTAREWEVIELLYEGRTTDQIADALVLSSETVRTHVKNILRKLDARSREEAVSIAQAMRGGAPNVTPPPTRPAG